MGVTGTVTFATLGVFTAMVLAAASASGSFSRYRPALVTLLVGFTLCAAYVVGFTIAVERSAHRARRIDPTPANVRECPSFMGVAVRNKNQACTLRRAVNSEVRAQVAGHRAMATFKLDAAGMHDAPNARSVAAELVAESAGSVQTPRAGRSLSRGVRAACCAANNSVHTDLSAM